MTLDSHIEALNELILFLEAQPVLPDSIAKAKNEAFMRGMFARMEGSGSSFGDATGILPHLNRPDAKEYLRSIDSDLLEQVRITQKCVKAWIEHGEHPPPYYPWRITVILRKIKNLEAERRFLAAYCKHFYNTLGSRNAKIAERAVKVGAYNP